MAKILIAEDEAIIRNMYVNLLVAYNLCERADIVTSETGEGAVSELEAMLGNKEKPQLVITDNQMLPGKMTGMNVIDYIKGNDLLKDVPVIMAASLEEGVGAAALERGAVAYFEKPLTRVMAFLETVRKYVR